MSIVLVTLIFNMLDIFTGIVYGVKSHDLRSDKLRDGLFKKVGFFICYFLAFLFDKYGNIYGFEIGVKIIPVVCTYVVTTETVSIIENIGKINPDILPEKLYEMFHVKNIEKGD